MGLKRRTGTKNPPIFSVEFLIQNHADIISCLAMVFVIGLLFQATAPFASLFVVMHHNTSEGAKPGDTVLYTYGKSDFCVALFCFLITIVMHAILQEYVLDKLNRKLHLSKVKHSKFNESGQLIVFYLISIIWGGDIIWKEGYLFNISKLWHDYPHNEMTFLFKFYYVVQLAYWVHGYPELFFQKVKKDEMKPRIVYTTLYLAFLTAAYLLNFSRLAVTLSFIHYFVEIVFHISRLLYFAEKNKAASYGFSVWNVLFVAARLTTLVLSWLTFCYGLPQQASAEAWESAGGSFNTRLVRVNCLLGVGLLQGWMMYNFIVFHLRRIRERNAQLATSRKKALAKKEKKMKKEELKKSDDDVSELPEADQNAKKELRQRSVAQRVAATASPKAKR